MKLKPCPFCGNTPDEDSHYINQGTKWGGILCCILGPEVRTSYQKWPYFKEAAIKEWNTRAPISVLSETGDALFETNPPKT